jgi:hypothetical protein
MKKGFYCSNLKHALPLSLQCTVECRDGPSPDLRFPEHEKIVARELPIFKEQLSLSGLTLIVLHDGAIRRHLREEDPEGYKQ